MTLNIFMIADDLTGANDSGVQLTGYGIRTSVLFHVDKPLSLEQEAIVVDTDSRGSTKENAYRKIKEVMHFFQPDKDQIVYKKIDSTLRGNLGSEIDAMYEAIHPDFMVIAPAFPKNGRKTIRGYHYLNDTLISETEMANDPHTPVNESYIPDLLQKQTNRETALIKFTDLEKGYEHVKEVLDVLYRQRIPYIVVDAVNEQHLQLIAQYVTKSGYSVCWVGSAGLANELPEVYGFKFEQKPLLMPQATESVMLVVGSVSQISRRQLEFVLQAPGVKGVELNSVALIENEQARNMELNRALKQVIDEISNGYHIAVYSTGSAEHIAQARQVGIRNGLNELEVSQRISRSLGEVSARIVEQCGIKRMVLTGGDTAKQVCTHLGITGFELMGEVEMGIPLGRTIGRERMYVITKAGAFGKDTSLLHAIDKLKGEDA